LNNTEQTPEAWLAVNFWKDLDWKEHETENPEDQKNWEKGIPVPLDYTEEELANSDSSWEACSDVSYAYCNEEPVSEEDRRMKACADEFNKEYEKSRAKHPLVDKFGDEQTDTKDSSDDDDDTFFTHSKGKCTRIEKTQSVIIENYSDPGTPMQDSIEYSPHSPQYI
jgi:hypothetical protein